jgi:hypothetical protein
LANAGEQVLWASGGLVVSRFEVDEAEEFDLVDDFNVLALGCQLHRPFDLAAQSEAVKRSREAHNFPIQRVARVGISVGLRQRVAWILAPHSPVRASVRAGHKPARKGANTEKHAATPSGC